MADTAVLGSNISHGGTVTSASPNVTTGGRKVARVGDTVQCQRHGAQTITTGSSGILVNGKKRARVGSQISCGATIIDGVSTVQTND